MGTGLILGFMLIVGHVKMRQANDDIHEAIAGETDDAALLYASELDVEDEYMPPGSHPLHPHLEVHVEEA